MLVVDEVVRPGVAHEGVAHVRVLETGCTPHRQIKRLTVGRALLQALAAKAKCFFETLLIEQPAGLHVVVGGAGGHALAFVGALFLLLLLLALVFLALFLVDRHPGLLT
ncbi:MAG: hypothetical protein COT06_12745, partial [Syntrophobacteraceae bacterium CG07_land_8_20_14_0_80_61_8]